MLGAEPIKIPVFQAKPALPSMKSKNIQYEEKIDHLRFFAAVLVLMFHSVITHFLWKPLGTDQVHVSPIYNLLMEGHLGVGLFMTLSGFLFARICRDKEVDILGFYRNRFLRIYPLFVFAVLLGAYTDQKHNGLVNILTSLCFMQNTEGAVSCPWLTQVLWTIAVEFQFYLLFPFLLISFRKYGYRFFAGLLILALISRFAVYLAMGTVKAFAYPTLFGRIDQFLIGMTLGFLFDRIEFRLKNPLFLIGSILLLWAAASHFHMFGGLVLSVNSYVWIYWTTLEGLACGALIVAYNASSFKFPPAISKCLAFGGALSFSLYVTHYFFLRTSQWFTFLIYFPDANASWLMPVLSQLHIHPFTAALVFGSCVVLPLTFLTSILTYFVIEKPFLELRSSYTRKLPKAESGEMEESRQERVAVPV
jgi:peptidoglycan/LPS O-acetylase OafA/YrhL